MTDSPPNDEWRDLSDAELQARLAQRGRLDAPALVLNRELPAADRLITKLLGLPIE